MDRKVPDEEEKKNPTKKSSSGCHNPMPSYVYVFYMQPQAGLSLCTED